jgi:hypothetical protein
MSMGLNGHLPDSGIVNQPAGWLTITPKGCWPFKPLDT